MDGAEHTQHAKLMERNDLWRFAHNLGKRPSSSHREALVCINFTWTRDHVVLSFAGYHFKRQVTRGEERVLLLAAGNVFRRSQGQWDVDYADQPAMPFEPREMNSKPSVFPSSEIVD